MSLDLGQFHMKEGLLRLLFCLLKKKVASAGVMIPDFSDELAVIVFWYQASMSWALIA